LEKPDSNLAKRDSNLRKQTAERTLSNKNSLDSALNQGEASPRGDKVFPGEEDPGSDPLEVGLTPLQAENFHYLPGLVGIIVDPVIIPRTTAALSVVDTIPAMVAPDAARMSTGPRSHRRDHQTNQGRQEHYHMLAKPVHD
jgi:hypothetical protein